MGINYKDTIEAAYKKLKKKFKRPPTRTELMAATGFDGTTIDTYTKGKLVLSKGTQIKDTAAQIAGRKKATETFKIKQYDKVTPTTYGKIKGPQKQINEYLKDFKKRFKYPITAREYTKAVKEGTILSNEGLMKKYGMGSIGDVERVNAILAKDHKLKYPKQTYEGAAKVWQDLEKERRRDIKKTSSSVAEHRIKKAVKTLGGKGEIDLAHRASLRANVMFGADYLVESLGLDKGVVNQKLVKPFERELTKLYKQQTQLIKGLKPGNFSKEIQKTLEGINYKISELSDRTGGALQGVLMDEKTGRVRTIYGKDYSKVLGMGMVEGLGSVKDMTPAQLDLVKAQIPQQMKAAKKPPTKLLANLVEYFNSKTTTTPQKNQIAIALQCIGKAEGGRIGYALGSAAVNCVNTKLTEQPVQSSMRLRVAEGVGKIKPAAINFLKTLGRGGVRAAPFAALAAVGAGIEPLVKQFVADDPNTYLTNEGQMKGMLLATIEGETPKVDEEILKWQMPAVGGATVAGAVPGAREAYLDRLTGRGPAVGPAGTRALATIPEKPVGKVRAALGLKGVLGKAVGATFSPLAVAATTPLSIAAQREGGTEWGDIATDPSHWFGPAFASTGYEMASRGIKNPTLLKALRLGISPSVLRTVSSRFGLPGLMISGGMWGYDKWKNRSINDPED